MSAKCLTEKERVWYKLTNHFVGHDGGPPVWSDGKPMTLTDQKWVMEQLEKAQLEQVRLEQEGENNVS